MKPHAAFFTAALLVCLAIGSARAAEPLVSRPEHKLIAQANELAATDAPAAIAMLEKEVKSESGAALDFTLAVLLAGEDRKEEALGYFRAALEKEPDFTRARVNAASILLSLDRAREAADLLAEDRAGLQSDADALVLLGCAFEMASRPVTAENAYRQALVLEPDSAAALEGLARCLLGQNRFDEAIAIARENISLAPDSARNWTVLANAQIGRGDWSAAVSALECASRLARPTAAELALMGDLYLNLGQTGPALSAYEKAFDSADGRLPLARMLAIAEGFMAMDDFTAARGLTERIERAAKSAEPEPDAETLARIGWLRAVTAMHEGDSAAARKLLQNVLAAAPAHTEALLMLGGIYRENGRTQEAVLMFERAERSGGRDGRPQMMLAALYVETGQPEKAVAVMEKALRKYPSPQAANYLERLRAYAEEIKD